MALHFWTQGCTGFASIFLWIIVVITSESNSTSIKIQDTSHSSHIDIVTYQRTRRSPDEETFQPRIPKKSEDLENTEEYSNETPFINENGNSESTSRENIEDDIKDESELIKEEPMKNKQSEPKKYNANDFKNFNPNKVNFESKTLASNESTSEKQKLALYNPVIKYNNSYKKDLKLNSSFSDYKTDNSNLKQIPSKFILEKKKVKTETDEVPMNVTKQVRSNETHLMSDQPMEPDGDLTHNVTDISDDESLDDLMHNTTSSAEDNYNTTSPDGQTMPSEDLNIVVISGVTLGTAVLLGLAAGGGFVFYRHRMWNKPQTLSDKCSNADSSGYIDDSTLRENSEEMYSLDNDSFLNSLEAMTIQNYWTDNVKHTKL